MDLDDEDEARLDAMQGVRDAIPSGADATTLRTMTMTMTRAETTIPTVTRGEEAKKSERDDDDSSDDVDGTIEGVVVVDRETRVG